MTEKFQQKPSLVSPTWLYDKIENSDLDESIVVLDCSWLRLPQFEDRNAYEEFSQTVGHIPGSRYFDIDEAADKQSPYEHMLPSKEFFDAYLEQVCAVKNLEKKHFVVYDTFGIFSSPRVWWTFMVFGYSASVLDGGLPAWKRQGYRVEIYSDLIPLNIVKHCNNDAVGIENNSNTTSPIVVSFEHMRRLIEEEPKPYIIDARPEKRFKCEAAEPRPGVSSGTIPGSINIPFNSVLNSNDLNNNGVKYTTFKSKEKLQQLFSQYLKNIDLNDVQQPLVCTCGSGITAAIIFFGLHLAGVPLDKLKLYDGSWVEWNLRTREMF